jgi:hypothetical protein
MELSCIMSTMMNANSILRNDAARIDWAPKFNLLGCPDSPEFKELHKYLEIKTFTFPAIFDSAFLASKLCDGCHGQVNTSSMLQALISIRKTFASANLNINALRLRLSHWHFLHYAISIASLIYYTQYICLASRFVRQSNCPMNNSWKNNHTAIPNGCLSCGL